jgi:hypothetical protein
VPEVKKTMQKGGNVRVFCFHGVEDRHIAGGNVPDFSGVDGKTDASRPLKAVPFRGSIVTFGAFSL